MVKASKSFFALYFCSPLGSHLPFTFCHEAMEVSRCGDRSFDRLPLTMLLRPTAQAGFDGRINSWVQSVIYIQSSGLPGAASARTGRYGA